DYVQQHCRSSENWRLANELSHILDPITSLREPLNSMHKWSDIKILQPYRAIKPWCQLILEKLNPNFQKAEHRGIALLFPMEILFEKYAASCLRRDIKAPWQLTTQASDKHMVNNQEDLKPRFRLKPDLLISKERKNYHILDTKWKLINLSDNDNNYNISQSDIYQLFAYGHKYLGGSGDMMLIYPKHQQFEIPLECFYLAEKLRLWAIPFCIETDKLVISEWVERFPSLSHT
ncbi:McrC family protein, partial [Psychrobacter celer]|uniref:McrC family protein n=1 Tax=Psychrobacter celer TaxID=306572 RepID=UPI003FD0BC01